MTRVIGLTGSIATGKSTAAAMVRQFHIPVFDADKHAHRLMHPDHPASCFAAIQSAFPEAVSKGWIDRKILGRIVFADNHARKQLEAIVHPKIREAEKNFIRSAQLRRRRLVLLDIPLLFETGAEILCDEVWVTYCPEFLQMQRLLSRHAMNAEKAQNIIRSQMPQAEKIKRADAIISSGLGKGAMMRQIQMQLQEKHHA